MIYQFIHLRLLNKSPLVISTILWCNVSFGFYFGVIPCLVSSTCTDKKHRDSQILQYMYKENSTCETLHELILCCCFVLNTCYLYIHFVLYVWYELICLIQLKHLCNFYFLSKNFFSSNNIYQRKKESSGLIDWLWFYVSSRIFPTEASQFLNRGLLEVLSVSRRFYLFYFEKWTGVV